MFSTRQSVALDQQVSCHTIIGLIDTHLHGLNQAFSLAFAGGYTEPTGDHANMLAIFKHVWGYLAAADTITFESLDDVSRFFDNFILSLNENIVNACALVGKSSEFIPDYKSQMLMSLCLVYKQLSELRFQLARFQEESPQRLATTLAELMRIANAIDDGLEFIETDNLKAAAAKLKKFNVFLLDRMSSKGYADQLKNYPSSQLYTKDDFIAFDCALTTLPSITELNTLIDQYHQYEDGSKMKTISAGQLQAGICKVDQVIRALDDEVKKQINCIHALNAVISAENKLLPLANSLNSNMDFIKRYNLMLTLAGADRTSIQQQQPFAALKHACDEATAASYLQSSAETYTAGWIYSQGWWQVRQALQQVSTDLPEQLKQLTAPYLDNIENVRIFFNKTHKVNVRRHEIDHERSCLAAELAITQAILDNIVVKLFETKIELNRHIESTWSHTFSAIKNNVTGMFVGAGTGSGLGIGLGYLAMAQPHIGVMAGLGALLGSAVGLGAGVAKDELTTDEAKAKSHQIKLIDRLVMPAKAPDSAHKRLPWTQQYRLFNHLGHGDSPPENGIISNRTQTHAKLKLK